MQRAAREKREGERTVITQERIPGVLDHPIYDTDGNKIGDARHVFLDDATGQPERVSVKTGLFGTSESFVPIRDASIVEDHLAVPYPKYKVKDAPSVDAAMTRSEERMNVGTERREACRARLRRYVVRNIETLPSDSGFQESGKAWARTQEQKGSRQS
jgi:hypothetical protein